MGHTPGPWRSTHYNAVLKSCNFFAIEAEDHTGMIAEVDDDTKDAEANARLIAAAPEMKQALGELLEWATLMGGWDSPAWERAQRAYNKAEGR